MNRINATWQYFSPLRFSFMGKPDPENTPAPGRVLTVLFGTFLAALSCLLLFLAGMINYTSQVICGILVIPLLLELLCGGAGLKALSDFLQNRQNGVPFEEALHGAAVIRKWSFSRIFLPVMLYVFRSIMIGTLAVCGSYYWLTVTLAGAYFVRAELSSVKVPGGKEFFETPEDQKNIHGPVCLLIMLAAGLTHSLNLLPILIAAAICWLLGSYGSLLCADTEQGMSTNAMRVIGYSSEIFLLLLGMLIYLH